MRTDLVDLDGRAVPAGAEQLYRTLEQACRKARIAPPGRGINWCQPPQWWMEELLDQGMSLVPGSEAYCQAEAALLQGLAAASRGDMPACYRALVVAVRVTCTLYGYPDPYV